MAQALDYIHRHYFLTSITLYHVLWSVLQEKKKKGGHVCTLSSSVGLPFWFSGYTTESKREQRILIKSYASYSDKLVLPSQETFAELLSSLSVLAAVLQRAEMSCTSARWSWATKRWASAPRTRRHCGRESWPHREEPQSCKTRRSCIVHSAKVCIESHRVFYTVTCVVFWISMGFPLLLCRCPQEQARGGVAASFPSAPAAPQAAPASPSPGHPLPRPAQAAHRTAARHSGGSRCAQGLAQSWTLTVNYSKCGQIFNDGWWRTLHCLYKSRSRYQH